MAVSNEEQKIMKSRSLFNIALIALLLCCIGAILLGVKPVLASATLEEQSKKREDLIPLESIAQISVGYVHTCAVTTEGKVTCWGYNITSEYNHPFGLNLTATEIPEVGSDVHTVATGTWFTCALTNAGGVKCWGANSSGVLGGGTNAEQTQPVDVVGLESGIKAIATGSFHVCALTEAGGVKCWGDNMNGQLGDGTTLDRYVPVDVIGLQSGVAAIAAGEEKTCALMDNGNVKCWGFNGYDTSSDFSVPIAQSTPADVAGLNEQVIDIATNGRHSCVITEANEAKCWGNNSFGELGIGNQDHQQEPVNVFGINERLTQIEIGSGYTCAVSETAAVYCWGDNSRGYLGNGDIKMSVSPIRVLGLEGETTQIALGYEHACALSSTGRTQCWGANGGSQLGNGKESVQRTPVDVVNLDSGILAVAVGSSHTCALDAEESVLCWGDNYSYQLGDGSNVPSFIPVKSDGLEGNVSAIDASDSHTCALTKNGGVKCWGPNSQSGQVSNISPSIPHDVERLDTEMTAIAVGYYHACALEDEGGVQCWGSNESGQLGNGTTDSAYMPSKVVNLDENVTAITSGEAHTCVIETAGSVKCWGGNANGQLGNGTTTNSPVPVDVVGLRGKAIAVTAGGHHSCAIMDENRVQCWGGNFVNQLGNGALGGNYGPNTHPVDVVGLSDDVVAIAAGRVHTCALAGSGNVKCWGYNENGQLGNDIVFSTGTPMDIQNLADDVVAIAAGGSQSCAIMATGGLKCWGNNWDGQIGNGEAGYSTTPTTVLAMPTPIPATSTPIPATPTPIPEDSTNCLGITWIFKKQIDTNVLVGRHPDTNAYLGDTDCSESWPLLCLKQENLEIPEVLINEIGFYTGWTGGRIEVTEPVSGYELTSLETADLICSTQFGDGWQLGEFHDGNGGWNWWAVGDVPADTHVWLWIDDQPANPWDYITPTALQEPTVLLPAIRLYIPVIN